MQIFGVKNEENICHNINSSKGGISFFMNADDFLGSNNLNHFMDCLFAGMTRSMNVDDISEGFTKCFISRIDGYLCWIFVVAIP